MVDGDKDFKESVTEAVTLDYSRYIRSHGKKPRDTGGATWMFTTAEYGSPEEDEIFNFQGSFADANKLTKESFDLDEATKKLTGGQRSAKMGAAMDPSEIRIPKRGTKAYADWMAKNNERRKAELAKWKNEEVDLDEATKDHFVYQKGVPKTKEVVHRGTEQSSKDWIEKNAKHFGHKGKDFDIYKGTKIRVYVFHLGPLAVASTWHCISYNSSNESTIS